MNYKKPFNANRKITTLNILANHFFVFLIDTYITCTPERILSNTLVFTPLFPHVDLSAGIQLNQQYGYHNEHNC